MATSKTQGANSLDYASIKRTFPLLEQVRHHTNLRKDGRRYVGKCPFHSEGRGSFNVYPDTNTFYCFSCSARGDVFDFLKRVNPSLASDRDVVEYLMPGGARIWAAPAPTQTPTDATTDHHEAGGVVLDRRKVQVIHPKEVEAHARLLRDEGLARASEAREYARRRRWLVNPDELYGVEPYPVGIGNFREGVLSEFTVLGFRKRVDEQTAYVFGLNEEFADHDGLLYVGTKMRLTPRAQAAYQALLESEAGDGEPEKAPAWLAKARYTSCIPGSVDYNYDAPVLVLCEGPGDGVRLFHEAHRTQELAEQFGQKVHICFADSARCLTEASLPMRARPSGQGSLSFFSGYKSVVLLFDNDRPDQKGRRAGRDGADVVRRLIQQQVPGTPVRDVLLPEGADLSDFFDEGGTVLDLIGMIKGARPVR